MPQNGVDGGGAAVEAVGSRKRGGVVALPQHRGETGQVALGGCTQQPPELGLVVAVDEEERSLGPDDAEVGAHAGEGRGGLGLGRRSTLLGHEGVPEVDVEVGCGGDGVAQRGRVELAVEALVAEMRVGVDGEDERCARGPLGVEAADRPGGVRPCPDGAGPEPVAVGLVGSESADLHRRGSSCRQPPDGSDRSHPGRARSHVHGDVYRPVGKDAEGHGPVGGPTQDLGESRSGRSGGGARRRG